MDMKRFLENPHEFARLYPITTMFGSARVPSPLSMKKKSFDVDDDTENGYQIKGDSRILWFRLERSQSKTRAGSSELMLADDRAEEDYLPTYWLPWAENQIYRITLRPNRGTNLDPDYFFTAPVNGCSVFVEGPPEQPTVYHANAQRHGGDFDQRTAKAKAFKRLQLQKAEAMRTRYLAFTNAHEKRSRNGAVGPGAQAREVNATDYLSRAFHPAFQDEMEEIVSTLLANTKGTFVIDENRITVTDVEGTVFGVREEGTWKFYFQKRVWVEFYVNEQKLEKSRQTMLQYGKSWLDPSAYGKWWNPTWRKGESWMTLTCAQFWPDGGGQAVVRIL